MPRVRSNFGIIGSERAIVQSSTAFLSGILEAQYLRSSNKWPGSAIIADILVVGGGGAGGRAGGGGGGGGAGGLIYESSVLLNNGTYTITVGGAGTAGSTAYVALGGAGASTNGANSQIAGTNFTTRTAI